MYIVFNVSSGFLYLVRELKHSDCQKNEDFKALSLSEMIPGSFG